MDIDGRKLVQESPEPDLQISENNDAPGSRADKVPIPEESKQDRRNNDPKNPFILLILLLAILIAVTIIILQSNPNATPNLDSNVSLEGSRGTTEPNSVSVDEIDMVELSRSAIQKLFDFQPQAFERAKKLEIVASTTYAAAIDNTLTADMVTSYLNAITCLQIFIIENDQIKDGRNRVEIEIKKVERSKEKVDQFLAIISSNFPSARDKILKFMSRKPFKIITRKECEE